MDPIDKLKRLSSHGGNIYTHTHTYIYIYILVYYTNYQIYKEIDFNDI